MRRTAPLGFQTPCLISTSLPQRPWYHWQLPAWYLLLLKHFTNLTCTQACISLSLSCLSHPLACCLCWYKIFTARYTQRLTCMHTHTHELTHTHTLILAQTKFAKSRAAEAGGVVLLLLSDLSVIVREQWFVRDLWGTRLSEDPSYLTDLLLS